MLNKIWPFFLIVSFGFAIFFNNLPQTNSSIFKSVEDALNLTITLVGTMCLWCGMMKIAMETKIIKKFTKIINPLFKILFPDIKINSQAYKHISMNIIANILGLGNAATPLGIKAMQSMQEDNKNKDSITNSMAMLIVLNTASIQIIPTTVIAIRNSLKSNNPTEMLVPIWIATMCAALAAIISAKIFMKKW